MDEERETVHALQGSLAAHGYKVLAAKSGEEAIKMISQQRPDLLLLDLLLTGMSGLEVCRQGREMSNLPIIAGSTFFFTVPFVQKPDSGATLQESEPDM